MKSLNFLLILLAVSCIHNTSVNKGDKCFEASGKEVSCEPFLSKLQEQEITASVEIDTFSFDIKNVVLPAENHNFSCGIAPQSGKKYNYYFSDHSLIVETDGKILKFQKDSTSISSILGHWVCYESNDRLLSAAHLNFVNSTTLKIHQLCR